MYRNSTAQALVQMRGSRITYGVLKFTPIVDSRAHSLEVTGFSIRRGNDVFLFEDLPVSRILNEALKNDIIFQTFEAEEDERSGYLELDLELTEFDERARLFLRVTERIEDMLMFEVEDPAGDWLPVEDVLVAELLPESFLRLMEVGAVGSIDAHNLDMLPIAAE